MVVFVWGFGVVRSCWLSSTLCCVVLVFGLDQVGVGVGRDSETWNAKR